MRTALIIGASEGPDRAPGREPAREPDRDGRNLVGDARGTRASSAAGEAAAPPVSGRHRPAERTAAR